MTAAGLTGNLLTERYVTQGGNMLGKKKKDAIIKKYKTHDKDTGSAEVQIAILTAEIKELTKHLKDHIHDQSSRRGLLRKVNLRRKLLKYLARENQESYEKIVDLLKLKKRQFNEAKPLIEEPEETTEETNDEEEASSDDREEE